jgi:hypothetical protein
MWRPFASDFVPADFDNFRKEQLKTPVIASSKSTKHYGQLDLDTLFPFKQRKQRLLQRQDRLKTMKLHVRAQRAKIRQKDLSLENSRIEQIEEKLRAKETWRLKRHRDIDKVRSMSGEKVKPVHFVPSKLYLQLTRLRASSEQPHKDQRKQSSPDSYSAFFITENEGYLEDARTRVISRLPTLAMQDRKVSFDSPL